MEFLIAILLITGVLYLLYYFGKETLITWTNQEYEPSIKEVIIFIILYMIAQRELINSFKNKPK